LVGQCPVMQGEGTSLGLFVSNPACEYEGGVRYQRLPVLWRNGAGSRPSATPHPLSARKRSVLQERKRQGRCSVGNSIRPIKSVSALGYTASYPSRTCPSNWVTVLDATIMSVSSKSAFRHGPPRRCRRIVGRSHCS